jgi:hypothetical protein
VNLTEKPQNGVEVEVGKHIHSIFHLLQVYGNASNIYVLICCSLKCTASTLGNTISKSFLRNYLLVYD